jgi:hypothetical protein
VIELAKDIGVIPASRSALDLPEFMAFIALAAFIKGVENETIAEAKERYDRSL